MNPTLLRRACVSGGFCFTSVEAHMFAQQFCHILSCLDLSQNRFAPDKSVGAVQAHPTSGAHAQEHVQLLQERQGRCT